MTALPATALRTTALPTTALPSWDRRPRTRPAYVWGYNNRAGLGLGHTARVSTPTRAELPEGTVEVQGGIGFTVVRTEQGRLFGWGGNQYGQLGDGSPELRRDPVPVRLGKGTKITELAAGTDHVLAVTGRGDVWAWGRNHRGQVGNGSTEDQHDPVLVATHSTGVIAAGNGISAAIGRGGELLTWGRNSAGQLGRSERGGQVGTSLSESRPQKARLPRGVVPAAIAAGHRHLAVLGKDGRLLIFGEDGRARRPSVFVPWESRWGHPVRLWAGDDFTLVLTSRHALLGFGGNASGQLGLGDHTVHGSPALVRLPGARGHVTQVWAGARSAAALTNRGELYTWGDASAGQSGRLLQAQDPTTQPTPRRVALPRGTRIAGVGGGAHHIVLTANHH